MEVYTQDHCPSPVPGSLTAERWSLGSVSRVDSLQVMGNNKRKLWYTALQEEVVLCCSAGTAEVLWYKCVYLWGKRGEERKDKTLKLIVA